MNLLVTGGLGFIGSNFINHIFHTDDLRVSRLINIDKFSYCSSFDNIAEDVRNDPRYTFIKCDLNDNSFLRFILQEFQITHVIHFAAQSHVDTSFDSSLEYTKDNVLGTHNLLDAIKNTNPGIFLLHFSTDEVYGESISGDDVKTENSILIPTNPYSASKAAAEMFVSAYIKSYNFRCIIARCNNVFGLHQYHEKVIPKFQKQLREGGKCTIHGNGRNIRNFIHVSDVSRAVCVMIKKGKLGEIYNISGKIEMSVLDLAQKLITDFYGEDTDTSKHIEFVENRPFNDNRYNINSDKLEQLGWDVKVSKL